jgi:hypothetical protein
MAFGLCEVVETAGLLPVGGVGPSRSSRSLPRLDGALLRCHQRGRGGGIPFVDPLYRSPVLAARREVSSLALCSEDGEATSVCAEGRRVELQARLFHGGASR